MIIFEQLNINNNLRKVLLVKIIYKYVTHISGQACFAVTQLASAELAKGKYVTV